MAASSNKLNRDQLADLASEITATARAAARLASMLDTTTDRQDRGALNAAIEAMTTRAGILADRLSVELGGVAVLGGAADWFKPASLPEHR